MICVVLLFFWCTSASAKNIRKSVYDGRFYPDDEAKLNSLITQLTEQARKTDLSIPTDSALKALILPHAGYIYSGLTSAHAVAVLEGKHFEKVIIIKEFDDNMYQIHTSKLKGYKPWYLIRMWNTWLED